MAGWAMGKRIDEVKPSCDVFALGKLLWCMLSGRSFLRLWYHSDPENDVEAMFPESESIKWAKRHGC